MNKVLFIGSSDYPIPCINGGAIQGLVTALLDQNEIQNRYNFGVVSIGFRNYKRVTKKYKNTTFYYIHKGIIYYLTNFFNKATRFFFRKISNGRFFPYSIYSKFAIKTINSTRPDIVFFESGTTDAVDIAKYYKNDSEIRFVYHVHADYLNRDSFGSALIIERFNYFVTVSDFIKKRIVSEFNIDERRAVVLKNAISSCARSVNQKKVFKNLFLEKYGIEKTNLIFVYCGRLSPEKGCKELIEAFSTADVTNCTLVIIGGENFSSNKKTKYVSTLFNLAKDSKNGIVFTGHLQQDEVRKILESADVGVIPSICNEAASLALVECRFASLATIASSVGGIPEYTTDEATLFVDIGKGFVERLREAIVFLATNKKCLETMSLNALKGTQEYTYNNYFQRFETLSNKILNDNNEK